MLLLVCAFSFSARGWLSPMKCRWDRSPPQVCTVKPSIQVVLGGWLSHPNFRIISTIVWHVNCWASVYLCIKSHLGSKLLSFDKPYGWCWWTLKAYDARISDCFRNGHVSQAEQESILKLLREMMEKRYFILMRLRYKSCNG